MVFYFITMKLNLSERLSFIQRVEKKNFKLGKKDIKIQNFNQIILLVLEI